MILQYIKTTFKCQGERKILERQSNLWLNHIIKNNKNTKSVQIEDDTDEALNKPIPYSTSKAADWPAFRSRYSSLYDRHPHEEENDIDQLLDNTELFGNITPEEIEKYNKSNKV